MEVKSNMLEALKSYFIFSDLQHISLVSYLLVSVHHGDMDMNSFNMCHLFLLLAENIFSLTPKQMHQWTFQ